jgi:hypothetical protein
VPLSLTPQGYLLLSGGGPPSIPLAGSAVLTLTVSAADLRIPAKLEGAAVLTLVAGPAPLSVPPAQLAGSAVLTLTATGSLTAGAGAQLAGAALLELVAPPAPLTVTGIGTALTGSAVLELLAGPAPLTTFPAQLAGRALLELRATGALVNYPELRPLRAEAVQRPVGRVEGPGGAPLPGVLRFTLESSLDTPADGWTAEVAGAALMLAPDDEALYRLPVGFLDAAGHEVLAQHVTSGRILDRRLVGRATERHTYVRGVDALERTFRIQRRARYVPAGAEVGTVLTLPDVLNPILAARQAQLSNLMNVWEPTPELQALAGFLRSTVSRLERDIRDANEAAIPEKVGAWTAKSIAADLLVGTGLTLIWTARDYSISVPFEAVGTLYEVLRRLVEPWNQAPPLGVDVTAYGTVVYVRPRLRHPAADLTMTVAESRLVDLELGNRRRLPYIGAVVLEGRITSASDVALDPSDTTVFPPIGLVASSELEVDYATDTPTGRVEGTRTFRMPDRLLIRELERVYTYAPNGGVYQSAETETNLTYEDSRYGPQGPTNQPLPLASEKFISTLVKQGAELVLWLTSIERIVWKYDVSRHLLSTTTRISRYFNSGGLLGMFETDSIVETYERLVDGWTQVKTVRDKFDPKNGRYVGTMTLQQTDRAGLPPGGPRPPFSLFGDRLANDADYGPEAQTPVRVTATISSDPTAVAVSYANPNLAEPDLHFILEQLRAVSGLVEYPLRGTGPALPDVIKGSAVHLTDFLDADGTPIPLEPALVRGIAFAYEDTRDRSAFTCELDAVFYRDE